MPAETRTGRSNETEVTRRVARRKIQNRIRVDSPWCPNPSTLVRENKTQHTLIRRPWCPNPRRISDDPGAASCRETPRLQGIRFRIFLRRSHTHPPFAITQNPDRNPHSEVWHTQDTTTCALPKSGFGPGFCDPDRGARKVSGGRLRPFPDSNLNRVRRTPTPTRAVHASCRQMSAFTNPQRVLTAKPCAFAFACVLTRGPPRRQRLSLPVGVRRGGTGHTRERECAGARGATRGAAGGERRGG